MKSSSVEMLVKDGVSFVCAMCNQLHEAISRGTCDKGCIVAQTGGRCGGPLMGMSFPDYSGPLRDGVASYMHNFCFVCGAKPQGIVRLKSGDMYGLCNDHRGIFTFSEGSKRPPKINMLQLETVGMEVTDGLQKVESQEGND